ncbi:hypothetical protein BKP54_13945 [Ensifer sp. 1H6]|nr:hypothetical protein BKP54_13945 [Ensifer sp. 1H6]
MPAATTAVTAVQLVLSGTKATTVDIRPPPPHAPGRDQRPRQFGDVAALEACTLQIVGAWLPVAAIAVVGERRGAIGRAAADLIHAHLALEAVGQTGDHHAEMQQHRVCCQDRRLLAAVLAAGRGEDAADFSHQRIPGPDAARLIEEVLHLRGHVTEPRRRADDDRVIIGQFGNACGGCVLVALVAGIDGDGFRYDLRHPFHRNAGACGPCAFRNGCGHGLDVTVGGVVKHEDLCHFRFPCCACFGLRSVRGR